MRRRSILTALALVLALATPGCASLRALIGLGPVRPKVTVTAIDVTKATLVALELAVTIRIDNPNDFDLDFSKLRYQMVATDTTIASGLFDERVVVPQKGRSEIKLPLSIDTVAAIKVLHLLFSSREDVVAIMTAVAEFETPFGAMSVDFEDKRPLRKVAGF